MTTHPLLTLRLPAGVADQVEVVPLLDLRQRGSEELHLGELGLDVRGRVLGTSEQPMMLAYGGYANDLTRERDHHLRAGGVARYDLDAWFVSADLRLSAALGGELDSAWEAWVGAAAARGFFPDRELTAGIETFAIVPLAGTRVSDPIFGQAAESRSFYYGPALSLRLDPFWTAASAVTGFGLSNAASELLVRWSVGVGH